MRTAASTFVIATCLAAGCSTDSLPDDPAGTADLGTTCNDHRQDGDETDVDCGGAMCQRCASDRHCNEDGDCVSRRCQAGMCRTLTLGFTEAARHVNVFWGAAAADFDQDGKDDLAYWKTSPPASIQLFHSNGDGTFVVQAFLGASEAVTPPAGQQDINAAAGDLDGDGWPDFISGGNGDKSQVVWAKGARDGFSSAQATAFTSPFFPSFFAADINSDGRNDVVVGGGSWWYALLQQDGGLSVPSGPVVMVPGNLSTAISRVGDANGDGHPDLFTMIGGALGIWMAQGRGDGTFDAGATILTGGERLVDMQVGDFDEDGVLDLMAMSVRERNGTYTLQWMFRPRAIDQASLFKQVGDAIVLRGSLIPGSATADFNRDGHLDVVFLSSDRQAGVVVLDVEVGDGNGGFATQRFAPDAYKTPGLAIGSDPLVGDFNGDGFPDLAVDVFGDRAVIVLNASR